MNCGVKQGRGFDYFEFWYGELVWVVQCDYYVEVGYCEEQFEEFGELV